MEDFQSKADSLITTCVAIYGFFPPSESVLDFVSSELRAYLLEHGFGHLTYEETHLAIQINAKGNLKFTNGIDADVVKIFGATVSVKFISDVLCLYILFRDALDAKLKNFIDGF